MTKKKAVKGQAGAATEAIVETPTPTTEAGSPAATVEQGTTEAPKAPVKKEKVMPTFEQALATAKEKNPGRYEHVLRVTELTKEGEPKRVVIACQDPQTKQVEGKDVSVCVKEREIAVQDLFQVTRCVPCADRVVRKHRRKRQQARVKKLKEMDRARKQAK